MACLRCAAPRRRAHQDSRRAKYEPIPTNDAEDEKPAPAQTAEADDAGEAQGLGRRQLFVLPVLHFMVGVANTVPGLAFTLFMINANFERVI